MEIVILDADDTMYQGDFWSAHTKQLMNDESVWEKLVQDYKPHIKKNPKDISKKWMQATLDHIKSKDYTQDDVESVARRVFERDFKFYDQVIEFLTEKVNQNVEIIICTANNDIAANIVKEALEKTLSEKTEIIPNVKVYSSKVDWSNFKVKHINVDDNKAGQLIDNEIDVERISHIFGDDPYVNDIGLFNLKPEASYLIKTEKNKDFNHSVIKQTTWSEFWRQ